MNFKCKYNILSGSLVFYFLRVSHETMGNQDLTFH